MATKDQSPSVLARSLAPFRPLYLGYSYVAFVKRRLFFSYSLLFRFSLYPLVPEATLFMPNEHVGEHSSFQPPFGQFLYLYFFIPFPSPLHLLSSNFFLYPFSFLFNIFHSNIQIKVRVEDGSRRYVGRNFFLNISRNWHLVAGI